MWCQLHSENVERAKKVEEPVIPVCNCHHWFSYQRYLLILTKRRDIDRFNGCINPKRMDDLFFLVFT